MAHQATKLPTKAPETINNVTKLSNKADFDSWVYYVRYALTAVDCEDLIDISIPRPSASDSTLYHHWRGISKKVQCWLLLQLDLNVVDELMHLPIVPEFADDFFQLIKMIIFSKRYAEINSFLETARSKPTGPPEPIGSPKSTDPKPTDPKSTLSDLFRIACDLIDCMPPSSTPPTVNNTVDNAQYLPEKQEELELDSLQIRDTEANEQKNAAKEDKVETDMAKKDTIEKDAVGNGMIENDMAERDTIRKDVIVDFTTQGYAKGIRLLFMAMPISYGPDAHLKIQNPQFYRQAVLRGWRRVLQSQIKLRINKLIAMKSSGWPD